MGSIEVHILYNFLIIRTLMFVSKYTLVVIKPLYLQWLSR